MALRVSARATMGPVQLARWLGAIPVGTSRTAAKLEQARTLGMMEGIDTLTAILILAELIADLLPPGVLNIVNGYGREAGMPLATSKRIAKIVSIAAPR